MNEISVIVNQVPGQVTWNFEEIKVRLKEELAAYQNTVYTDETIPSAKQDVAALRKLSKTIDSRRLEVKKKCLEPYEAIEKQADELKALIEEPIKAINEQVDAYEKKRKAEVLKEIDAYWAEQSKNLSDKMRQKAYSEIYDSRWLNATTPKKTWKEAIENRIRLIHNDTMAIKSFNSKYEEEILAVYENTLQVSDALRKMNELNAQEQRILELERIRQLEKEAIAKKAEEDAKNVPEASEAADSKEIPTEQISPVTPASRSSEALSELPKQDPEPILLDVMTKKLIVTGTAEQIRKIISFCSYAGATVTVMED